MSKRGLKLVALALCGGTVLQLAGCASAMLEQMLGSIVGTILSALIQNILNTTATGA